MRGQSLIGLRPVLVGRIHAASEVIDRVVTTPDDPVVGGESVVVELIGGVTDTPWRCCQPMRQPAVRRSVARWRDVVVDRHGVEAVAAEQAGKNVGGQHDPFGRDDPARGVGQESARPGGQVLDRVCSWTATPAAMHARANSVPAAGCTIAHVRALNRPARSVGEFTCARTASASRNCPCPLAGGLAAATAPGGPRWPPPACRCAPSPRRGRAARCRPASRPGSPAQAPRCRSPRPAPSRSWPWVMLASTNPPLRPEAAQPTQVGFHQHDAGTGFARRRAARSTVRVSTADHQQIAVRRLGERRVRRPGQVQPHRAEAGIASDRRTSPGSTVDRRRSHQAAAGRDRSNHRRIWPRRARRQRG